MIVLNLRICVQTPPEFDIDTNIRQLREDRRVSSGSPWRDVIVSHLEHFDNSLHALVEIPNCDVYLIVEGQASQEADFSNFLHKSTDLPQQSERLRISYLKVTRCLATPINGFQLGFKKRRVPVW